MAASPSTEKAMEKPAVAAPSAPETAASSALAAAASAPSSEKAMEKKLPAVAAASASAPAAAAAASAPAQMMNKNSHEALSSELIEGLKDNNENWGEESFWNYDEEKMGRVWEIQEKMDVNDLMHYVMYGDGEEVVWDDDVWGLREIKKIPKQLPRPLPQRQPKPGKGGEKPPLPPEEKPKTTEDGN